MPAIKKRKLCINILQVYDMERVHTLWSVKFCFNAGANLFSLTCKFLQENKISSDHHSNIMVKSSDDNVILDHQIKTETSQERAQSATAPHKKNMNDLHVELSHPSQTISHATTKTIGFKVIVPWERPKRAE